ncbi:unnamed protein product [Bursaphelenchus xylophilus]|uniref:(pine wood nematode) hypothetical protein n=1 Tax=Bursaphelenchus xylophilus TaxID=6326 RepID=A0A7I8WI30_BURXY|nr:unnamed protein product [Bursaphelenchus xylophilus]CAG9109116.1 unnamed protein product [Bursaphelenchus xylophilus]
MGQTVTYNTNFEVDSLFGENLNGFLSYERDVSRDHIQEATEIRLKTAPWYWERIRTNYWYRLKNGRIEMDQCASMRQPRSFLLLERCASRRFDF